MLKKLCMLAFLLTLAVGVPNPLYAADTKVSDLPSATLTDADEVYVNDGGTSSKATISELRTALGGVGFIPLDITSLREVESNDIPPRADGTSGDTYGGLLALDSVPILERSNDATDKSLRVHWIVDGVEEVIFPPIPMPPDLDEAADVTVHLVVEMSGASDTPTIDIQAWDGVGDTEMGGASGALADGITEVSVTLSAANISGHPTGFLNIQLVPGGHSTDAIYLYAVWIEYTKKLPV